MREALDRLVKSVGLLQGDMTEDNAPYALGSPAGRAADSDRTALPHKWTAWFQALTMIHSAADHMFALERTLAPHQMLTYSPWTICRTILGATDKASWLLSPDIEEIDRTGRCLGLQLEELKAMARISKPFGNEEAASEFREISESVRELGRRMHVKPEEYRPVLGAQKHFHLLSAAEHQNVGVHDMLSQTEISIDDHTRALSPGLTNGQVHDLVRSPCRWFGIASWRYFRYCGLESEALENVLAATGEVVGLPDGFWTQADQKVA